MALDSGSVGSKLAKPGQTTTVHAREDKAEPMVLTRCRRWPDCSIMACAMPSSL
jgi:hypothetical protein